MNTAMLKIRLPSESGTEECPGWIPEEITENRDRDLCVSIASFFEEPLPKLLQKGCHS